MLFGKEIAYNSSQYLHRLRYIENALNFPWENFPFQPFLRIFICLCETFIGLLTLYDLRLSTTQAKRASLPIETVILGIGSANRGKFASVK